MEDSERGIDRRRYKMLKAAFKEEREARLTCEIEFNNLIQKYDQQSSAFEDFKDKNL